MGQAACSDLRTESPARLRIPRNIQNVTGPFPPYVGRRTVQTGPAWEQDDLPDETRQDLPHSAVPPPSVSGGRMTDVAAELEEHRPHLLKFAALQLRQKDAAEDLVQEVFLSALKGADGFSGRSSVRTWLTSILLNKIADYYRKAGREVSIDALAEADSEDGIDALFRKNGHYAHTPQAWRNRKSPSATRGFATCWRSAWPSSLRAPGTHSCCAS